MRALRTGRLVFAVGFALLLVDGAAAIWLGQVSGRGLLVVVGLGLIAAAAAFAAVYRRWRAALADIEAARAELKAEVGALRGALDAVKGGRRPPS